MTLKRRIMMFEPCAYQWLVDKGSVMSIVRPGCDLGADYQEHLHYVFPYDLDDGVHAVTDRCTVHSFAKGKGYLGFVANAIRVWWKASQLVRREKIDVVMSADPYVGAVIANCVAIATGRPSAVGIAGEHDVIFRETGKMVNPALKFRWFENLVMWIGLKMTDMIIMYVDAYRPYAMAHGGDPKKMVLCQVGAPDRFFIPAAERGKPSKDWRRRPGDKLIAYTGRVDNRKYADHLLRIYQKIVQRRDDVTCLFIGDGPDAKWIREELDDMALSDRIIVTGFLPNEEVWKILPTLDVYIAVLAGLALIEAAAVECPIVAYDTDWHPEIIKHEVNGLLVPFQDYDAYADAICRLLDDEPLRKKLGQAARRQALKRHTAAVVMKTWQHFYEQLIAGKRAPFEPYPEA